MSLLSRQLETHRINNPLPPPADAKKSRPTILFTSAQAANLDAREILDLGKNAYAKLCQLQPDLQEFQLLFGTVLGSDPKSEHHLLPRSEKLKVDAMAADFLAKLTPYYSTEPAVHVLEFLIQRYQVHIVSSDVLLSSLLPHHETKLFSTVVRLVMQQHGAASGGSRWAFLQRFADAPNGVPRSAFVQAAGKDSQLIEQICSVAAKSAPKFFSAFSLELLAAQHNLDAAVSAVCRNVVDLLKSEDASTRALACLVIAGMARTVTLSSEACEAFLMLLVKRAAKVQPDDNGDLIKCMVMLYEWQTQRGNNELFQERWERFAQHLQRVFPQTIKLELQQQKLCTLVDDALQRDIASNTPDRFFPLLKWNEHVLAARAARVLALVLKQQQQDERWNAVVQQISLEQPSAFQQQDSASAAAAALDIDFTSRETIFLALRNPNRMIRRAALEHLEQSAANEEVTDTVIEHWCELYLDTQTEEEDQDLARLLALCKQQEQPVQLLKQVVLTEQASDELKINALQVLKTDLVFVLKVQCNTNSSAQVKSTCDKLLKKTWLQGIAQQDDFTACGKHLRSLKSDEERRQLVEELYREISPEIAFRSLEASADKSLHMLELLERGSAVAPANAKLVATAALSQLKTEELVVRLLEGTDEAWMHTYSVLIEVLREAGAAKTEQVLWRQALSTLEQTPQAERRLVRTLRLLAYQQQQPVNAQRWIDLLGALRYPKSGQVRLLASKLVSTSSPLSKSLNKTKEEELERDFRTVDRIVASDKQVKAALTEAATSAESSETVRCIVELCKDRKLARKVIAKWLPLPNSGNNAQVVRACFDCYGKEAELEDLQVLELGLKHSPLYTLEWATAVSWLESTKAKFTTFESLYQLALAEDNADIVALAVKLLGQRKLTFDEQEFATRMQKGFPTVTANNAREVQILVECVSMCGFHISAVLREMLRLLAQAKQQFGLLEQTLLVAVERNIAQQAEDASWAWVQLVDEMCTATTLSGRGMARRAFTRSKPTAEAFALAFSKVNEFTIFAELERAMCASNSSTESSAGVVEAFAKRSFALLPFPDHHLMLAHVAKWLGKPSPLVEQWLSFPHTSRNTALADCVYIAAQFDSTQQTDMLIQLMPHKHCIDFIAHHLGSKVFMKALLASVDESKSVQFIHLFELLLVQLVSADTQQEQLETALDRLSVLLSIHVFVPVMSETLAERQPVKIRNLALRVLKLKIADEHRDWTKEEVKYVMEFVYTLISWLNNANRGSNHATTVLAINAFASVLASSHPNVFAKAVPVLSKLLDQEDEGADELQRSAVLVCLGTICKSIDTHALVFLNELVPKMIACSARSTSNVLRSAALHALKDIVEAKLAINLQDLVQLVMLESGDGGVEMETLIDSIGTAMEPRTGVSVCLTVLRKNEGLPAAAGLVALLDRIVSRLTVTEMPALQEVNDLCVECVLCEGAGEQIVSVVVKLALLLSEKKLKTVLDSLVALVESGRSADVVLDVLRGLVQKCGSLVLPIVPIQFMIQQLDQSLEQIGNNDNNKRAKVTCATTETALGAVGECLVHAIGTKFVDMTLFESLLLALVRALGDTETEVSQAFVEPVLASLALCVLMQPSVNAMLQTLHHSVTKLLKSKDARVRFNALSSVKTLFERVGDDYLALMPDTLPFLAELLEDADSSIRVLAQKLALVLKDLSGEDITEFLK